MKTATETNDLSVPPRSTRAVGVTADPSGQLNCARDPDTESLVLAASGLPQIDADSGRTHPQCLNSACVGESADVVWSHESFEGRTSVQRINETTFEFRCQMETLQTCEIKRIGWSIKMPARTASVIDSRYRWEVCGSKPKLVDAWTPLAIKAKLAGEGAIQYAQIVAVNRLPASHVRLHRGTLEWSAWLDHEAAHPRFTFVGPLERNWHNTYQYRPGEVIDFSFRVMLTERPVPFMVPGRYPGRRRGLVCITDHADHDTCERFAALMFGSSHPSEYRQQGVRDGFAGLGLPFTKSVFSQTNEPDGAGLHNPRFAKLCDEAHECGIELGPHGVHRTRDPDPSEYPGLMKPFEKYGALTWIDHGRSFQCNYGRSGWDPSHTHNLHQMLDQLKLRFLWGRLDFGQAVPNRVLDQLRIDQFSGWNYLRDLPRTAYRAIRDRRPWAFVHELATLLFQLIPDQAIGQYFRMQGSIQSVLWRGKLSAVIPAVRDAMKLAAQILTPHNLRQIYRQAFGAREELRFAPTCFREHGSRHRAPARWLFNTVAVHDVEDAFDNAAIQRLLEDYGTHLSHTYLASVSRAHLSHALERHPKDREHWRLTPRFANNLRQMAREKEAGRLWFASFGEVGSFWEQLWHVTVVPEAPGVWTVKRHLDKSASVRITMKEIDLPLVVLDAKHDTDLVVFDSNDASLDTMNRDAKISSTRFGTSPLSVRLASV